MKHKILTSEGRVERAYMETVHGSVETPVFMNVGTVATIKGAVSTDDLREIGTQIQLSNTYHLHARPGDGKASGDRLIHGFGGLYRFMHWDGPILTDSGDLQIFSLSGMWKIKGEEATFRSHISGRGILMGPGESMQIQLSLGSTIAMAFDKCPLSLAERSYIEQSVDRTTCWLRRCKTEMARLNTPSDRANPEWFLSGINQGGIPKDVYIRHTRGIGELDLDGYAVGGPVVGESTEEMYRILDAVVPELPREKPTYLTGVGMSRNILEAVKCGVDFFDCVYPSRNGRHGHAYTNSGRINLFNKKYELDPRPIEEGCGCPIRRSYSRVYVHHLLKVGEVLGMRLYALHNLYFYNTMMQEVRNVIGRGEFRAYKERKIKGMEAKA